MSEDVQTQNAQRSAYVQASAMVNATRMLGLTGAPSGSRAQEGGQR
jgi:hypothetical protein